MTEPPEDPGPPDAAESGEFAEFFHTEDLPESASRAARHRSPPIDTPPFLAKLLAPATAVIVVIVVIVLLIWINGGSSGNKQSPAAVGPGTTAPLVTGPPGTAPVPTRTKVSKPEKTPSTDTSPSHPVKKPHPSRALTPTPSAIAPVTVLNNSRRTGLAAGAAAQLKAKGWKVVAVGNLQTVTPETTVYYPPREKGAARHLADDFSSVQRIEPNSAGGFHAAHLTLVLTQSWRL